MKRFLVTLYISDNGQRINCIKCVRRALGIDVMEAKNLVERNSAKNVRLTLNAEQVANLLVESKGEASGAYRGVGLDPRYGPELYIESIEPTVSDLDFSNITPP